MIRVQNPVSIKSPNVSELNSVVEHRSRVKKRHDSVVGQSPVIVSIRTIDEIIEWTFARQELAAADRALFHIAGRHVKFTLENSAVVARIFRASPETMLVPVPNPRN